MGIQNDGFTKDPSTGSGGGFTAPTGTGFVKVTGGTLDAASSPLNAADNIWAVTTTTRSTNAFSGDLATAPASLATGLIITWRVPSAPSGASTYNLNSLGAKNIFRGNAAAAASDLPANRDVIMRYDGTQWQIIGFGTLTANDILPGIAGVVINLGTSSGTANALAGASTVDIATTFTTGRLYHIRTNAANTGAATIAINGGTGVAMRKSPSSAALASGDIADATELLLYYDGTYLQVIAGLTVSATDNTKLPTDGSGSMTAAIIWSGAGSSNSSNYEILRTTAGIIQTVPSGATNKMRVGSVDHLTVGADGNGWDWHLGRVDSSSYGRIWCVSSSQDVNVDVPSSGVAHVRVGTTDKLLVDSGGVKPQGTGGTGHILRQTSANGAISSSSLTPSDLPGAPNCNLGQTGTNYTNSGTWVNFYSLAAGTHAGTFFLYCSGSKGYYAVDINSTTLTYLYSGWTGVSGDLSGSPGSGSIGFRVSGGWLQIYVGTSVSGSYYYSAQFGGIAR